MKSLRRLFTLLEWLMIVLVTISAIFDFYVAITWANTSFLAALPLILPAILLTAVIQGVWIKCMRGMVNKPP